ncbi:hypothetical protein [Kitasatospora cathayae]|uniref:Uncharacterized protein n=1 Tax=Kitasatospora cathayae TaxID=3004092 RepID=A0ABY7Q093_9ACTN|nr:hypothetical protein [Kitasatospora sp. HUAS 3-15]WBP86108.1 hypothetical protein O1G21_09825 [Kitasatospora sp. HUAS 3-15]
MTDLGRAGGLGAQAPADLSTRPECDVDPEPRGSTASTAEEVAAAQAKVAADLGWWG